MERVIHFRDCNLNYDEDYDRYETLKNMMDDCYRGGIRLDDFDSRQFLILVSKERENYSLETWLLAHYIGAPMSDIVDIVKKIASTLDYNSLPELVNDSKFLK